MRKISSLLYFLSIAALALMITLTLNPAATYAQAKKDLVDLNKASEKELEALKGVGPATAKKIIENRPYKSVDELSKAGVPAKTIQDLKPFVTVGPAAPKPAKKVEKAAVKSAEVTEKAAKTEKTKPAKEKAASAEKAKAPAAEKAKAAEKAAPKLAPGQKVNINTATKEQLEALPEIGPAKAQAIIEGRPFQKPEDIMKVKGIKEKSFNKLKEFITVK